jgi:hypothetical protein
MNKKNKHFRKVLWISLLAGFLNPEGFSQQTGFKLNDQGVFNWPFIWYENEAVIDGCAGYIYLAALVDNILQKVTGELE